MIYFFNTVIIVLVVLLIAVIGREFWHLGTDEKFEMKRVVIFVGLIVGLLVVSVILQYGLIFVGKIQ